MPPLMVVRVAASMVYERCYERCGTLRGGWQMELSGACDLLSGRRRARVVLVRRRSGDLDWDCGDQRCNL